jgi:hypothetical protein
LGAVVTVEYTISPIKEAYNKDAICATEAMNLPRFKRVVYLHPTSESRRQAID